MTEKNLNNPYRNYKIIGQYNSDDRLIVALVVIGIIASWGARIFLAQMLGTTEADSIFEPQSKPLLYYALQGIGLGSVIAAGILAGISGEYRKLNRSKRLAFWLLQITNISWAFIAYKENIFSFKVLGDTGPFVWLACVLIFAGMNKSIWRLLDPTIRLISYITAAIALYAIISSHNYLVERFESAYVYYMLILMWFGGWTFLTIGNSYGWRSYLRYFPYIVFIITSIFTRTRSWFLMSIILFITHYFVIRRANLRYIISPILVVLFLLTLLGLFLSSGFFANNMIVRASSAFLERAYEDTRTYQYQMFFSDVPVTELILGRGPTGTWNWEGREYQYIDNAYIWMAFIGGLPTMVSFFVLIILPGIKAYIRGARGRDAAAAVLLILYGLACTGFSTYSNPSLTPFCYILYLMAGRCLAYIEEHRNTPINRKCQQ